MKTAVGLLVGLMLLVAMSACQAPEGAVEQGALAAGHTSIIMDAPADYLTPGRVNLTGKADPGTTLEILVDGDVVGETQADADGSWSFMAELPQAGDYFVSARSSAGSAQAADPILLSVISIPTLDKLGEQNLVAGNLVLTGTGEPGLRLEVLIDETVVGETWVDAEGAWQFATDIKSGGTYAVQLLAYDADDNALDIQVQQSVALSEPASPTMQTPKDLAIGKATLRGAGQPGWQLRVFGGDRLLGATAVDEAGRWMLPVKLLRSGELDFRIVSVSPSGSMALSAAPMSVTVEAPPAAEVAETAEEVVEEVEAAATQEPVEATVETDEEEMTLGLVTKAADLEVGENLLLGTGVPGTSVEVLVNGESLETVEVDDEGHWQVFFNVPESAIYSVSLQALGAEGDVVATAAEILRIGEEAAETPLIMMDGSVTVGDVLVAGVAAPAADLEILIDDEKLGTATADEAGAWELATQVTEAGRYTVTAQAVTAAGDLAVSDPFTLDVLAVEESAAATRTTDEELADAPVADAPVAAADTAEDDEEERNPCEDPAEGEVLGDQYIVGECEWITKIADRLGLNYLHIIDVNPQLEDPASLMPGMIINLPPGDDE